MKEAAGGGPRRPAAPIAALFGAALLLAHPGARVRAEEPAAGADTTVAAPASPAANEAPVAKPDSEKHPDAGTKPETNAAQETGAQGNPDSGSPPDSGPPPAAEGVPPAPATAGAAGPGTGSTARIEVAGRTPASPGGSADDRTGLGARRFDEQLFRSRLETHWFKRKGLLRQGALEPAAAELNEIAGLCQESGVQRLTPVALALCHEGETFLLEGNFDRARTAYGAALRFAPDMPLAHAGLARVAWGSGEGITVAAGEASRAIAAQVREEASGFRGLSNALLVGAVASLIAAWIFGALMLVRHQRALRHDVEEALARRVAPDTARLAGGLVLAAPILTWFLAPWTPAWWLAILGRYQRTSERVVSCALLVLLAASGPLALWTLSIAKLSSDPGPQRLLEAAGGSFEPDTIVALEEVAGSHAADPFYPSLLGAMYARGRFFEEALLQYRKSTEISPSDPRPVNNIGNLYFKVGRFAEAAQEYRRAIEIDPAFLPPYVNLYLARQAMFNFTEANAALDQGRAINEEGIRALLETSKSDTRAQEPIDSNLTSGEVWNRILATRSAGEESATAARALLAPSSIAGFAGLILFALVPFAAGKRGACCCQKCGVAFCRRCQSPSEGTEQCSQCRALSLRRDGLSQTVRRVKLEEITRHQEQSSRLERLLSLVLPGSGLLLRGSAFRGLLLLALWSGLLALPLSRTLLLAAPARPVGVSPLIAAAILAGLAVWIAGNLPLLRSRTSRPEAAA